MAKPLEPAKDKGNASIQIADEGLHKINENAVPGGASVVEEPGEAEKPAETTTIPVAEPEAAAEAETKPQT